MTPKEADAMYVALVRAQLPDLTTSDKVIAEGGRAVCEGLETGIGVQGVLDKFTPESRSKVLPFIAPAGAAFCPDRSDEIAAYFGTSKSGG